MVSFATLSSAPFIAFALAMISQFNEKKAYIVLLFGMTVISVLLVIGSLSLLSSNPNPEVIDTLIGSGIYALIGLITLVSFGLSKVVSGIKVTAFDGEPEKVFWFSLGSILFLFLSWVLNYVLGTSSIFIISMASLSGVFGYLIVGIFAPIMEELFFRGVLNTTIDSWMEDELDSVPVLNNFYVRSVILGIFNAIIYMGFFAVAHQRYLESGDIPGITTTIIISIVTTILMKVTNDIRTAIVFHLTANNLVILGIGVIFKGGSIF